MTAIRATLALLAALLLALPAATGAQGNAITGTINYAVRSALPNNAVVTVQLARLQAAGAPQVIAEQRFTTNGAQVPFSFTLLYDPARIDGAATYTIQGNIAADGVIRFTTDRQFRVITQGAPTAGVAVTMVPVGNLPNSSGGYGALALGALLAAGFVGVRLVRRRLAG